MESEDLMTDLRFSCPDVLRRHGIKSAVNVIIRGKERPVGVLEVDSQHQRSFTQDVNFLQGSPTCWRRRSIGSSSITGSPSRLTKRKSSCLSCSTG